MENGGFVGVVVALFICALITISALAADKLKRKKILKVKDTIPKEIIDDLENTEYVEYEENSNFLIGKSYIYEIYEDTNRMEIKLIFCRPPLNKLDINYDINVLYMDKKTFQEKNLKVGDIVPTTHNRQYEALYKINEIIFTK